MMAVWGGNNNQWGQKALWAGREKEGGFFSRNGRCLIAVIVVGGGNRGARRALSVQGRGRTSIVMRCHCNNEEAVNNVAAVTTMTTPSLVAMALSAAQNINQQTKGANKRRDGDDGIGRWQLMREERSTTTMTGNKRALMGPSPTYHLLPALIQ
jgi:hypothetical protein